VQGGIVGATARTPLDVVLVTRRRLILTPPWMQAAVTADVHALSRATSGSALYELFKALQRLTI